MTSSSVGVFGVFLRQLYNSLFQSKPDTPLRAEKGASNCGLRWDLGA
ncbi:MAG: hypothetical protein WB778_07560 [Thermoplasmata archaeon]